MVAVVSLTTRPALPAGEGAEGQKALAQKIEPPRIEGRLDAVAQGRAYGWAWDRANPGSVLVVELRRGGNWGEMHPFGAKRGL